MIHNRLPHTTDATFFAQKLLHMILCARGGEHPIRSHHYCTLSAVRSVGMTSTCRTCPCSSSRARL